MGQELLLLTGIPGAGKTTAGLTLASRHGFVHMDAEEYAQSRSASTIQEWVAIWEAFAQQVDREVRQGRDVVVTWGFMPGVDNLTVRLLQSRGFKMIWFDGNREAARREFLRRKTVSADELAAQMGRIADLDLASFGPTEYNSFGIDGNFLPRETIADQLLALT